MSLDKIIHLSPFIKIPIQQIESTKDIWSCENDHWSHPNIPYCSGCGKEITKREIADMYELHVTEIMESENFVSYNEYGFMYLFSNFRNTGEVNTQENTFTELTQQFIENSIEQFKKRHQSDIDILTKKLNTEIVVSFGFVYNVY